MRTYLTYEKEIIIKQVTENESVICYIPPIFADRVEKIETTKNIPSPWKHTIYRFYGIKKQKNLIGYVRFSISTFESCGVIDTITIVPNNERKGLGSILLNESLSDIIVDFPEIEKMQVCSTKDAIPFYLANDFTPYFGDNNLERKLTRK